MSGSGGDDLRKLQKLAQHLRVPSKVRPALPAHLHPGRTADFHDEADADTALKASENLLVHYQARLAAQDTYGLLVILQGMDASGKDGAIKHVMSGVNPQGVTVHSFKVPSDEELNHDFLWRYTVHMPQRGTIGIFNRSQYEEVLVVRVHPEDLVSERVPAHVKGNEIWSRRYREINEWERALVDNGIHVAKIFLNMSKDEQRRRFLSRIDDPEKNWKFSIADIHEREYWDDYQRAYADMLAHTNTDWAPWHVVPADHKWFARVAVAAIVVAALAKIDPRYPKLDAAALDGLAKARAQLEHR